MSAKFFKTEHGIVSIFVFGSRVTSMITTGRGAAMETETIEAPNAYAALRYANEQRGFNFNLPKPSAKRHTRQSWGDHTHSVQDWRYSDFYSPFSDNSALRILHRLCDLVIQPVRYAESWLGDGEIDDMLIRDTAMKFEDNWSVIFLWEEAEEVLPPEIYILFMDTSDIAIEITRGIRPMEDMTTLLEALDQLKSTLIGFINR